MEDKMKVVIGNTFALTTICTNSLVPCTIEKGNNPMRYLDEAVPGTKTVAGATTVAVNLTAQDGPSTEDKQRKYLEGRVFDVWYKLRSDLLKQFYIYEPEGPKSAKELAERLKKGLYTIDMDEEDGESDDWFHWNSHFSWRTPETQSDRKGYDEAMAKLDKFHQNVMDTVKIGSPADGLQALKDFEAWTTKTK
jgi:hypothetical protein